MNVNLKIFDNIQKGLSNMKKIVFIGAGSFGFTRCLVRDILSFPALADSKIVLMDIDPGAFETRGYTPNYGRWIR